MIIGDITNTKHLNKAFKNIDIVFHFAKLTWKKQIKNLYNY